MNIPCSWKNWNGFDSELRITADEVREAIRGRRRRMSRSWPGWSLSYNLEMRLELRCGTLGAVVHLVLGEGKNLQRVEKGHFGSHPERKN